ncbi:MAG: YggT family protein [Acidiphilium sp.]
MLAGLFWFIEELLQIYIYVLIAAAIFSWLMAFGLLDTRNRIVWRIEEFLLRATEPVLNPLRRVIPPIGGIDISFIIAFLILQLLHNFLIPDLFARLMMMSGQ